MSGCVSVGKCDSPSASVSRDNYRNNNNNNKSQWIEAGETFSIQRKDAQYSLQLEDSFQQQVLS